MPVGLLQLVPETREKETEQDLEVLEYVHVHLLQFVHVSAMLADVYKIEPVETKIAIALRQVKYLNIPLSR